MARRVKYHAENDVWERRDKPPADWNRPLPEHLAEISETSYLRHFEEGKEKDIDESAKSAVARMSTFLPGCTIQ